MSRGGRKIAGAPACVTPVGCVTKKTRTWTRESELACCRRGTPIRKVNAPRRNRLGCVCLWYRPTKLFAHGSSVSPSKGRPPSEPDRSRPRRRVQPKVPARPLDFGGPPLGPGCRDSRCPDSACRVRWRRERARHLDCRHQTQSATLNNRTGEARRRCREDVPFHELQRCLGQRPGGLQEGRAGLHRAAGP